MQIKILNQSFSIQGVEDEAYVQKLASFVEDKMTELQRATNTIDSYRLALLAALHIADAYFQMEEKQLQLNSYIDRKSAEFVKVLEQFTE